MKTIYENYIRMKYNLNQFVIGSSQFLDHVSEKMSVKPPSLHSLERLNPDVNTYLLPYHFLKQHISSKDWESFKVFYGQLLKKSDIECENIDDIFTCDDIVLVYSFIVAAQYYFL